MVDVAVIGGGIGGLTAATELARRGCSVTVYEAADAVGGKARSYHDGPWPPGEHGFRFFPAFYRHVVDTMGRIPAGDGSVADRLRPTERTLVAGIDRPDRSSPTHTPTTVREWLEALRPPLVDGLPPRDVAFVVGRLLYLLTACDARREAELEHRSWWSFMEADRRSARFRERLANATRSLVALDPRRGSARTVGDIYLQLLLGRFDRNTPTERVLDAPSTVAWFDPWVDHLENLGVDIVRETAVDGLVPQGERIARGVAADGRAIDADEFVLAVPVHEAPGFVTPELAAVAPELEGIGRLDTAWMNGVQCYLDEDARITRGHQIHAESPWALTSISQRQFWTGYDFEANSPEGVEGVLSVIISAWDAPGLTHRKPARTCTREELVTEVWAQLVAHLNGDGDGLPEGALVGWSVDPAIVETEDGLENRSPLFINTVGSLADRPPADPAVKNLTLAGEYVRTNADLASMESADEAGRRAANAVIDRHGLGPPAAVWDFGVPPAFEAIRRRDRALHRLGLPHPLAAEAGSRSALEGVARMLRPAGR